MKLRRILALVITLTVISACSPTSTAIPVTPASGDPIPTKAVATVIQPTVEPQQDRCVECHTDKSMLIDTAKPEEVVEQESEGTG